MLDGLMIVVGDEAEIEIVQAVDKARVVSERPFVVRILHRDQLYLQSRVRGVG